MPSGWARCKECGGSAVVGGRCIGHLSGRDRDDYGERVAATGLIDARGAKVRTERLVGLLREASAGPAGGAKVLMAERAVIGGHHPYHWGDLRVDLFASFADARFEADFRARLDIGCPIDFSGTVFEGEVQLEGRLAHNIRFVGARFEKDLSFKSATVEGNAIFASCHFGGRVDLTRLQVARGVEFSRATLPAEFAWSGGRAGHEGGTGDEVGDRIRADDGSWWQELPALVRHELVPLLAAEQTDVLDAPLASGARFSDVVFQSRARFDYVHIRGAECAFTDVRFRDVFDFQAARFAANHTTIRASQFEQRLSVAVDSSTFDCMSSTFAEGADLDVVSVSMAVEDCRFGRSSVLRSRLRGEYRPTRLVSLRRTDCEHLRVLNMDLSPCRFAGTHNLDKLVIEGPLVLAEPPPPRRATKRKIIAEEWDWRSEHDDWVGPDGVGWGALDERPGILLDRRTSLTSTEVAALYRGLRKGSEDAKDEPGAADFYYGEMEMRRRSPGGGQRLILWVYWVLSGYGLRPSRTLASIVVTLALFAALFQSGGFADSDSQLRAVRLDPGGAPVYERQQPQKLSGIEQGIDAVIYTAGTATTIISGPERPLNRFGRVLRVILRIAGPILIALLVLSIRGRVKR